MSSKSKAQASNVSLTSVRQDVLDAAVSPLLEGLETRSLFSVNVAPVANPGGPYSVGEGQSVMISGLGSTDSDGSVATYQWDTSYSVSRGFRNRLTSPTWTFTADDSGTKTIALKVIDNNGDVSSLVTTQINISDVAPTLSLTLPGGAQEASLVNVSWSYTDAGVSDTVNSWNVDWGDGTDTTYAGTATGGSHTYDSDGTYAVVLTATQTDATTSVTQQLTVGNVTPVVSLSTTTQTIDEGARVKLNFASPNRTGTLDSWLIDWGDGKQDVYSPATGQALHLYTDSGNYTATVYAQEPDGGYGSATQAFTINNVAPTVTQTNVPATGTEGTSITIGSTVVDGGIDDTHTYGWTVYKNGSLFTAPNATASSFTFTPTDNGSYVVRLSVVDDEGAQTTVNSPAIVVANATPTASVTGEPGSSIAEGTPVNLTVTAADAGALDTFTYAWSVAKGGSPFALPGNADTTSASFTFTPTDNGTYAATCVVTDKDGANVSAYSTAITVTNVAPIAAITGTPSGGVEGTEISVSATVTDSGAADTHSYLWSVTKDGQAYTLPNGVNATGSTFAFVPTDNGVYEIDLTVTDDDTAADSITSAPITVTNAAPTAQIAVNATGTEGAALTLTVAAQDAGANENLTYLWTVTKNGQSYNLNGATATAASLTFTPNDNGTYVASVVVTDKDGDDVTVTRTVTVANADPVPTITGAPTTGNEGTSITVGSTVTDAGLLDTHTYAWTVKKDNVAVDVSNLTTNGTGFTFTPADNGSYVVTLAVTDNNTGTASVSTSAIVVANVAPTANVTGAPVGTIYEGDDVHLTAYASDAGTADTFSYAWSIAKDGQTWTPASGTVVLNAQTLDFTSPDNGSYVASVVVTDKDGATVTANSTTIVVANVNPQANVTAPVNSDEGTALSLTSTVTDRGTADTHTYLWSVMKDGQPVDLTGITTTAAGFDFTPVDNGTYEVNLVVTDDDNGSVTTTRYIGVNNAAPVPVISGNSSVNEDAPITLTVAANDPGVNDTHTFLWSVTRNGVAYNTNLGATNGTSFTFTPNLHGTYAVSCAVTDNSNRLATATKTIIVNNVAPTASITGVPTGPRGEGSPINLSGTAGDVSGETGLTYAWSVKRGNVSFPLPGGTVTNTSNFEFTPTDNGLYKVTLTVTDSGGLSTSATTSNIVVTNALPDAAMTGIPSGSVTEGSAVSLHVDAADPGAEDVLNYAWTVTKNGQPFTLPGGTVANAANFTFVPTDNGTYVATCLVTDDDGGPVSVNSGAITVTNVDPVGSISRVGTGTIYEGAALTYDAVVTDAGSADTFTYAWTATKDGQPYALSNATGASLTFTPIDQGAYVLTLVVTDDDAGTHTSTQNVTVLNAAPVISSDVVATTGTEGVAISLTGDATDAGVNDTLTYSWTITTLDGSTTTRAGKTNSYTPYDNGTYTIRLSVTDKDGTVTLGTPHTVVVANANPTVSAITAATTGTEGAAITASVTATDVYSDTITLAWTVTKDGQAYALTNGTVVNASQLTFTPTDNGSYTLTLVATDEDAGSTTVTKTITVANANPTAAVTGDTSANEGSMVGVEVAATDAGADDLTAGLTYAWTVTKNGLAYTLPTGTVTNAATLAWTPADNGTYAASVVVSDKDNGTVTQTHDIVVANVAPTAVLSDVPSVSVNEGTAIGFSATATDAGTEDTIQYSWVVEKDGEVFQPATDLASTASSFSFTPTDNGSYVVKLYVTDGTGGNFYQTAAITVSNVAPTGTVAGPTTANEGSAVTVTATAADAGSVDTLSYAWTVTKNGETFALPESTVTNAAAFTFTPTDEGVYVASVVVSDDDTASVTLTHEIAVANVAPAVSQTNVPATGVEGTAITVGSTATDAGDDTLTYGWTVYKNGNLFTLPDGTTVNGSGLTFTPTDNGKYVVRLSVNDGIATTTVNSEEITVANAAPTATISGSTSVNEGTAASFNGSATDTGSLDAAAGFTYAWKARKGNSVVATGDAQSFSFTPSVHGSYGVELVVTDKDGTTVTTFAALNVANVAPKNVAIEGEREDISEGDNVHLVASASDVAGDTVALSWKVMDGESVFTSGTGRDIDFTAARGQYRIVVTATDTAGATASADVDLSVANVVPTAAIASNQNGSVLTGSSANFSLTFEDVPADQALDVSWDFGDGAKASNSFTGGSTVVKKHTYAEHGTYTVTATISDGEDEKVVTTTIVVSEATMITDPMDPRKTALLVIGGDANDTITVNQTKNGRYSVDVNGDNVGSGFAPTGRIYVYGNGGSNTISVTGTANAVVFAGSNASSVSTGSGNDIVIGGNGADRVNGGDGRDVLIGMADKDVLRGGDGEDLLISGGVAKTDTASLASLAGKWGDGNLSTSARRNAVLGLFNKKSLIADSGGNQLYGESKNDWFVIGSADKIKDLQKTDLVN